MGSGLDSITRREFLGFSVLAGFGVFSEGADKNRQDNKSSEEAGTGQAIKDYYNTAISKLSRGEEKEGLDMLLNIVKEFPSSADAHFVAANACVCDLRNSSQENCVGALRNYNRAIGLDEKMAEAYVNRSLIRCLMVGPTQGELSEMWNYLGKKNFDASFELPLMRKILLTETMEDLDRAIKLKPNLFSAHFNKGQLLYYFGKHQEAVDEFSKAIETGLKDSDWSTYTPSLKDERTTEVIMFANPLSLIGAIVKYAKDKGSTWKIAEDRLVMFPPDFAYLQNLNEPLAFAYFHKGMCYAQPSLGKYTDAIRDLNAAIRLNPNVPRFYEALIIAHLVTKQYEDVSSTTEKYHALTEKIQGLLNQVNKK